MKQYIHILVLVLLLLTACNNNIKSAKNIAQTVQENKAKDTPEIQQMLTAFNKQKHRL